MVGAVGAIATLTIATSGEARSQEPADPGAPGAALVEVCASSPVPGLPTLGPGTCATLSAGAVLLAAVCGHLPVDPASCAELTDGRPIDPDAVTAFEHGWVPRALRLQGRLDEDQPLRNELIPHTHNSFNAPQYGPTLTTSDPNHRYSLTDQLRMGIRGIELDVHWLPSPYAAPGDGGYAVTLCHGETEHVGDLSIHVGCTVDRPFAPGLDEVADYLRRPGNEHEFVLLYLQNELDGNPAGHAAAIELIEQHVGPLVARPPAGQVAGTCADLPLDRPRADFLAQGKQVMLVGNCGPGPWSSWVFQRGEGWDERGGSGDYPAFPACEVDRAAHGYDAHFIRFTEDSTWLTAITSGPALISEPEVRAMVRCGVDFIGLDRIGPADPRLADLVWSWAPDEPGAAGHCASWGTDARFRAADCSVPQRAACRTPAGAWVLSDEAVPFAGAFAACRAEGATFEVPRSGWEDERLRAVAAPAPEAEVVANAATGASLWLNLGETSAGWRPALVSAAGLVAPASPAATPAGRIPATGGGPGPVALAGAGGLLVVALGLRRLLFYSQ
jgi:hypothetical protein